MFLRTWTNNNPLSNILIKKHITSILYHQMPLIWSHRSRSCLNILFVLIPYSDSYCDFEFLFQILSDSLPGVSISRSHRHESLSPNTAIYSTALLIALLQQRRENGLTARTNRVRVTSESSTSDTITYRTAHAKYEDQMKEFDGFDGDDDTWLSTSHFSGIHCTVYENDCLQSLVATGTLSRSEGFMFLFESASLLRKWGNDYFFMVSSFDIIVMRAHFIDAFSPPRHSCNSSVGRA